MEKLLGVFEQIHYGKHGPYAVFYPDSRDKELRSKVNGSITVGLDDNILDVSEWSSGVVCVLEGLHRKVYGWRAKRIMRLATPDDEKNLLHQEKQAKKE